MAQIRVLRVAKVDALEWEESSHRLMLDGLHQRERLVARHLQVVAAGIPYPVDTMDSRLPRRDIIV